MERWEYKVEIIQSSPPLDQMNNILKKLGADGWELVCNVANSWIYIFKRKH